MGSTLKRHNLLLKEQIFNKEWNPTHHYKLTFLADGKYLLPGIKCSSKTNIPSSKHCLLYMYNSPVTTRCQIYDKTKLYMIKSIDNAFDHYGIILSYKQKNHCQ